MAEYDNNMTGVLFRNDKQGKEKRPDYRGSATVNGAELNVSGWIKASKKTGNKFLSLRFEPKMAKPVAVSEDAWDDPDAPF